MKPVGAFSAAFFGKAAYLQSTVADILPLFPLPLHSKSSVNFVISCYNKVD